MSEVKAINMFQSNLGNKNVFTEQSTIFCLIVTHLKVITSKYHKMTWKIPFVLKETSKYIKEKMRIHSLKAAKPEVRLIERKRKKKKKQPRKRA